MVILFEKRYSSEDSSLRENCLREKDLDTKLEASLMLASFCNVLKMPDISEADELLCFLAEQQVSAEDAIWIVTDNSQIEIANQAGVATVGYFVDGSSSFLHTNYVVQNLEEIDEKYLDRVRMRYHGIPWTIGETKRCSIREFSMEDLDSLFELYEKPNMTDFMEPLFDYEQEKEYQKAYIRHMYGYYEYGMWLIFDRTTKELIGRAGLEHRQYGDESELELGYMIAPEYQGRGYATEVCRFVINYAWQNTEFDKINCLIDEKNIASIGLTQKLGFEYAGKIDTDGHVFNRYILYKRKK